MSVSYPFLTVVRTVVRVERARVVTAGLLDYARWFALTPLPGGRYEVAVRAEDRDLLEVLARAARILYPATSWPDPPQEPPCRPPLCT